MKLKLKWKYAEGEFDTKTVQLIGLPARPLKNENNAEIAIKDSWNFSFAEIDLGDVESSNAFAKEIVRRWNEFPKELKK
ncbi:MAG: hypothetical protein IJS05_07820 [Paludibacteraceae bacterium]|nr:hypothetical protein [Paludibacteraceae bacterium]